jgi:hypothetical protein
MSKKNQPSASQLVLTSHDDVDLIRFEKNLLKIGFFSAQDGTSRTKRTISTITYDHDEGSRETASTEIECSVGLPSTPCRDKYMAMLKIASEQSGPFGQITNPIRFSGYRMRKELRLAKSGLFYEDINAWGQRMVKSTITSSRVIYLTKGRRYANKTLNIFQSFQRVGYEEGRERTELYEVVLSDWLLENQNANYALAQDFHTYKMLKRPIAKGIFGSLHFWFNGSKGQVVSRDYRELCVLLDIQVYNYLSKIKLSIGPALDELKSLSCISAWEIQPMSTKDGFKVMLWPGKVVLRSLRLEPPASPQLAAGPTPSANPESKSLDGAESPEALRALIDFGITRKVAQRLVEKHEGAKILDMIEYWEYRSQNDKNGRMLTKTGLLVNSLDENMPIPPEFVTKRMRESMAEDHRQAAAERQRIDDLNFAYDEWRREAVDTEIASRYPGSELGKKLAEVAKQRSRSDPNFIRAPRDQWPKLAEQIIKQEIREECEWPSFETWCQSHAQINLFDAK